MSPPTTSASPARAPGLLLHDLGRHARPRARGRVAVIRASRPDVLLLTGFDDDPRGRALDAFRALLRKRAGRHRLSRALPRPGQRRRALRPRPRRRRPGYGLERRLRLGQVPRQRRRWRCCRACRWTPPRRAPSAACPGPRCQTPTARGARTAAPSPTRRRRPLLRLSSRVALGRARGVLPDGWPPASPRRQPDAAALRRAGGLQPPAQPRRDRASGPTTSTAPPFRDDQGRDRRRRRPAPLVVLGNLNADPARRRRPARTASPACSLSPRLRDPRPASAGARRRGSGRGVNARQPARPPLDTADWRDDAGPGNLRVDYVLPRRGA